MSKPPTLEAMSYHAMYVYGNHICVLSVKKNLTTSDYGVAATFFNKNAYWVGMIKDQFLPSWNM
jgi:hypothetical protein